MRMLTVRHATTYRYARPVSFGPHRLMLRPRNSHDLRLVSAELTLSPPGNVRWMHDVFGNSVALVDFLAPAATLAIASTLKIERYGIEGPEFPIAPEAEFYPFIYSSSDRVDLGRLLEQHFPDPNRVLARWADSFVTSAADAHARPAQEHECRLGAADRLYRAPRVGHAVAGGDARKE